MNWRILKTGILVLAVSIVASAHLASANCFNGIQAFNNGPVCEGQSLHLFTNPSPGGQSITFFWTGPNGFMSTDRQPVIPNVTTANDGDYTVTISNSSCTSTFTTTASVVAAGQAAPPPTITGPAPSPADVCAGTPLMLNASTSYLDPNTMMMANYASFQWFHNGTLIAGATTTPYVVVSAAAGDAGTYTVTGMRADGGCPSDPSTGFVVNILPAGATPTITPGGLTTFCQGGSVTLTSSAGAMGATYLWSPTNETTPSIMAVTSGMYTVTVTDPGACPGTSAAVGVTVNQPPSNIVTGSPTTFCQGGMVTLQADTATATSWLWSPNNETTSSIVVSASGMYSVKVTAANGCFATSSPTTVTVNPLPTAVATADNGGTTCQGATPMLHGSGGTSCQWSSPDIGLLSSATDCNPTFTSLTTGMYTYSLVVTDANGCVSTNMASVIIDNQSDPTGPTVTQPSNATVTQTLCQ